MTGHDYMNDPRMSEFKDRPFPACQVRAWRLEEQDKKQGMTPEQRVAYYEASRRETDAFCAERGIKLKYAESTATV